MRRPEGSSMLRSTSKRPPGPARSGQLVVGVRALPLAREQPADHRVLALRELDHESRVERSQPIEELGDRHVGGDRDVVDERQGQGQVGGAPPLQLPSLEAAPPEARRGVGEIADQRQDAPVVLGAQRAVERLDGGVVGVDRDDAGAARPRSASRRRRCSRGPRRAPGSSRPTASRTKAAFCSASSSL